MSNAAARTIKGGVLSSRLSFLRSRGGDEAVERVFQRLPKADVALLRGTIAPAGWYSFDTGSRLDAAIAEELGGGEALFLLMGAQSAEDNLSHAQRAFVRERDPLAQLKSAASIYRLYYKSGRRTFERVGERKVVLRTYDSETFSRADCLTVVGWHERVIGMCGGKKVHVEETKCRARGDDVCEYVCEWD